MVDASDALMDDLLGMNEIPYDSNPQGNQGNTSLDEDAAANQDDPYTAGYGDGKKKKCSEHIHAAVKKRVNIIHSQVIFFRAFMTAVKLAPTEHLSGPKAEKLAKFVAQLEHMLQVDAPAIYLEAETVDHLSIGQEEKLAKMANLQKLITQLVKKPKTAAQLSSTQTEPSAATQINQAEMF